MTAKTDARPTSGNRSKSLAEATEEDSIMADVEEKPSDALDATEPSFGDLVLAHATEPIDVEAALNGTGDVNAIISQVIGPKTIKAPSASSLSTVLTQALQTDDTSLLESCLHSTELNVIRATLERLDSSLAAALLQKIADRLHRRPGRAGTLMVWVQWTLVSHGGYLAGQPQLMGKLNLLHNVIKERTKGLHSLLLLKGKLDMLEAQMQLRRNMERDAGDDSDEEAEERVIYVEGQEEVDSEEEDEQARAHSSEARAHSSLQGLATRSAGRKRTMIGNYETTDVFDNGDEEDEEMPGAVNGLSGDDDDEEDGDEESEQGMFDEEAEETDADSNEEGDDNISDLINDDDTSEDGSRSEAELPLPTRSASILNPSQSGRRA